MMLTRFFPIVTELLSHLHNLQELKTFITLLRYISITFSIEFYVNFKYCNIL